MPSQDLLASQIASEERNPALAHPGKENISFSATTSSSATATTTTAAGKNSTGNGKARRKPPKVGRVDVEALVQKRTVLKDVWNEVFS